MLRSIACFIMCSLRNLRSLSGNPDADSGRLFSNRHSVNGDSFSFSRTLFSFHRNNFSRYRRFRDLLAVVEFLDRAGGSFGSNLGFGTQLRHRRYSCAVLVPESSETGLNS
jgi:hypothetical protein